MLKRHLANGFAPADVAHDLARIERRLARRKAARRAAWVVAPTIALAALLASWSPWSGGPDPLRRADASELGPRVPLGRTRFDDGSSVELDAGGELALVQRQGAIDLALTRGRVTLDVRPGGPRRWSVRAGPLTVRVVGTSFTVERSRGTTSVSVHRGVVEVDASGATRLLYAGERFAVGSEPIAARSPDRATDATTRARSRAARGALSAPGRELAAAPRRASGAREAEHEVGDAQPRTPASRVAVGARQRPYASRAAVRPASDRAESLASAEAPVEHTAQTDAVAALLARSDAARRAGRLDEAAAALAQIVQHHQRAPEAATAAASLGRLEQDRGRLREASRAYVRALELRPPPALAELVYERLVRVSLSLHSREDAARWAAAHHRAFPVGRRTAAIDALLSTRP